MKVLIIGSTGTIGSAVAEALIPEHEVLLCGHSRGKYRVDIADPESIRSLFQATGPVDAVICCAGQAAFGPLESLTDEQFALSLRHKLMGQVNLVRLGTPYVQDSGFFTLTSGMLAQEPIPGSVALSLVGGALESFTRAAALELPRAIRINIVSPPWVSETLAKMGRDPDQGIPARQVAQAYRESLLGNRNGDVLDGREFMD